MYPDCMGKAHDSAHCIGGLLIIKTVWDVTTGPMFLGISLISGCEDHNNNSPPLWLMKYQITEGGRQCQQSLSKGREGKQKGVFL